MNSDFASVIEKVQKLTLREKEELQRLLEKYLIEERRKEIYGNYQSTLKEEKNGLLKKPKVVNEFKRMLGSLII